MMGLRWRRAVAVVTALVGLATAGLVVMGTAPAGATPTGCGYNSDAFAATAEHGEGCSAWTASARYGACVVYNTQSVHKLDPTGQWVWQNTAMQYWNCSSNGGPHPIGYVANVVTYDNIQMCMRPGGSGTGYLEFWGSNFSGAAGCMSAGQGRPCAMQRGGAGYGYGAHFVNDTGNHADIWCLWAYGPQYDPNGGMSYTGGVVGIHNHDALVQGQMTPLFSMDIDTP